MIDLANTIGGEVHVGSNLGKIFVIEETAHQDFPLFRIEMTENLLNLGASVHPVGNRSICCSKCVLQSIGILCCSHRSVKGTERLRSTQDRKDVFCIYMKPFCQFVDGCLPSVGSKELLLYTEKSLCQQAQTFRQTNGMPDLGECMTNLLVNPQAGIVGKRSPIGRIITVGSLD